MGNHITLLMPRTLRWLLDFSFISAPLMVTVVIEMDNPFDVNLYLIIIIIIIITIFYFTQFLLMKDHEILTVERRRRD
jgi:hypothetical protein